MKGFSLKIRPKEDKEELTIIYEDAEKELHKLKAPIDDILRSLQYFQNKSKEIHEMKSIYIQESIPFELFNRFINSINTQEIVIDEDNYQSYYYLSNKYGFIDLRDQIQEFIQTRPDIKTIIDEISASSDPNLTVSADESDLTTDNLKEDLIARNLDISLKNGNMHKIPLKKLNRILNSPKRLIIDHHLLFSFVISVMKTKLSNKLSQEEIDDLSILPSSLDFCQMTNDEIEELFKTEKSFNFFDPKNSRQKIESLIEKEHEMAKRIDQLEDQVKKINDSFVKKIGEFENRLKEVEKNQANSMAKEDSFQSKIEAIELNQSSFGAKIKDHESKLSKIEKLEKQIEVIKQDEKVNHEGENGIFKYLFDKYKANPAKNGIIRISGNSNDSLCDSLLPNIIDDKWTNDYWYSEFVQNSYVKIEFARILVRIDRYTIRVGTTDGSFFFTSWTLTGITESNQEVILDDVNNSTQVTQSHPEATISLQGKPFVRSIQITMKGNHSNPGSSDYAMAVRHIELFGLIKE